MRYRKVISLNVFLELAYAVAGMGIVQALVRIGVPISFSRPFGGDAT